MNESGSESVSPGKGLSHKGRGRARRRERISHTDGQPGQKGRNDRKQRSVHWHVLTFVGACFVSVASVTTKEEETDGGRCARARVCVFLRSSLHVERKMMEPRMRNCACSNPTRCGNLRNIPNSNENTNTCVLNV